MNAKVWHLSYFEGVFLTQMIRMFENANARMVCMLHTMHMTSMIMVVHQSLKVSQFTNISSFGNSLHEVFFPKE